MKGGDIMNWKVISAVASVAGLLCSAVSHISNEKIEELLLEAKVEECVTKELAQCNVATKES